MKFSLLTLRSLLLTVTVPATAASVCPDWSSRSAGETWDASVPGVDGTHRISLPASYVPGGTPVPVILYYHGWGGSPSGGDSFCQSAGDRGYACIRIQGMVSVDVDFDVYLVLLRHGGYMWQLRTLLDQSLHSESRMVACREIEIVAILCSQMSILSWRS